MTLSRDLDDLLAFATRVAEGAGAITLRDFGRSSVGFKADGSEVTRADQAAEAFIIEAIRERYPDDAILAEEGGARVGSGAWRWIVDPIDGTRSYAAGVPLYGVLVALQHEGATVMACCHLPALARTLAAAAGAGAWMNGSRARVSSCDQLAEARLVTSGLEYWRDWATEPGLTGWRRLVDRTRYARTWGDCFGYSLIATGDADLYADPACGAEWDLAPMPLIIREAGGRLSTLAGEPVEPWATTLASNGRLHAAALDCWKSPDGNDRIFQRGAALERRVSENHPSQALQNPPVPGRSDPPSPAPGSSPGQALPAQGGKGEPPKVQNSLSPLRGEG